MKVLEADCYYFWGFSITRSLRLTNLVCYMSCDRCECCLGKKTVLGLGGIIVKCKHCFGVGYVSSDVAEVVPPKRVRNPKVKVVDSVVAIGEV